MVFRRVFFNFPNALFVFAAIFCLLVLVERAFADNNQLQAHWEFNELRGNQIVDTTGNNDFGLRHGARRGPGIIGRALYFSKDSDYLEFPDGLQFSGTAITVTAWVFPSGFNPEGGRILSKASGAAEQNHDLMLSHTGSNHAARVRIRISNTTTTVVSSTSIPANQWSFLAATFDGSTIRLYQDGNQVGSAQRSGSVTFRDTVPFAIGRNPDGHAPYRGAIDDVRLYNIALTESQIIDLMQEASGECGDGKLDVGEECDDGNTRSGDGCSESCRNETRTECNDGVDNDGDGLIDFPNDPGCTDSNDNTEATSGGGSACTHRPNEFNTGPYNRDILVPSGSLVITQGGTAQQPRIYENLDVTGVIDIRANYVTLRNFRVDCETLSYCVRTDKDSAANDFTFPWRGITIEYGELMHSKSSAALVGGVASTPGESVILRSVHMHHVATDAIKAFGQGVLVEYTLADHLGMEQYGSSAPHADFNQVRQGGNHTYRCNDCNIPIPESQNGDDDTNSNSCHIIQTAEGPIQNIHVEDNWLNGGNNTVYFEDKEAGYGPPTGSRLVRNLFGRDYRYGLLRNEDPTYFGCGNRWEDTGELIPQLNNSDDC